MRTVNPQRQEERRQQILEGASRCFIEKGFHQASMADIAKASGASMGLLYRYFRNKEAMVAAFAKSEVNESAKAIDAFAECRDFQSGLRIFVDTLVRDLLDDDYLRTLTEVAAECGRNSKLLTILRLEDKTLRTSLRAMLRALRERKLISPRHSDEQLVVLLPALWDGLASRRLMDASLTRQPLREALMSGLASLLAVKTP